MKRAPSYIANLLTQGAVLEPLRPDPEESYETIEEASPAPSRTLAIIRVVRKNLARPENRPFADSVVDDRHGFTGELDELARERSAGLPK